jgi:hypothetical protein
MQTNSTSFLVYMRVGKSRAFLETVQISNSQLRKEANSLYVQIHYSDDEGKAVQRFILYSAMRNLMKSIGGDMEVLFDGQSYHVPAEKLFMYLAESENLTPLGQ